jgi:hypothetical protein
MSADSMSGELTGFIRRLLFALSPLGAGIILDLLDAATFGPIGIGCGVLVGGLAGWYLGKLEGLAPNLRFAVAVCSAAYMTIPFTEAIPAATMLLFLARFFAGPRGEEATPIRDSHPEQC